ncbi:Serine kinase of the HPr protein, regulates carb ohydrate metabolism [uncultured Alphaproteobacteria bacterium]|uniref:Serine kinase of the HPr protein, regulates carb ohydrate metabolism n=1 Tax=uncultured Alphaproteobacteria bacterium TaxID=91750 RepID=A0A212KK70_9PROT|nr:Serine kinase of the HPr protein, regulates carb ohydrate metabolism [uncultured Alphaproteobacteria bacterium]
MTVVAVRARVGGMSTHAPSTIEHASAVAVDGRAILIYGPSGCGKSDLALRLIDRGARLIADDRTVLRRAGEAVLASPPETIAGLIEVRGLGVVAAPGAATAADAFPVALAVRLVADPAEVVRMPDPASRDVLGVAVPELTLWGFAASAAAVVTVALDAALDRREVRR